MKPKQKLTTGEILKLARRQGHNGTKLETLFLRRAVYCEFIHAAAVGLGKMVLDNHDATRRHVLKNEKFEKLLFATMTAMLAVCLITKEIEELLWTRRMRGLMPWWRERQRERVAALVGDLVRRPDGSAVPVTTQSRKQSPGVTIWANNMARMSFRQLDALAAKRSNQAVVPEVIQKRIAAAPPFAVPVVTPTATVAPRPVDLNARRHRLPTPKPRPAVAVPATPEFKFKLLQGVTFRF